MPGCGKSTVGVVLAKQLGFKFIDSDILIQEQYGKRLSQLIDENGDAGFIKIENDVNKGICADRTVIATGGSAVYGREAMSHFKKIGTVVYLEVSYQEIEERLGSLHERGVISNGKDTVEEIYQDRVVLYEQYADITLHEEGQSIRELTKALLEKITESHSISY